MNKYILSASLLFTTLNLLAHPMPNSVVSLSVLQNSVYGEAKMPLVELESALGKSVDTSLNVNTTFFKDYFFQHIKAVSGNDSWATIIKDIHKIEETDLNIGNYQEVVVHFILKPSDSKDLRLFDFDYNAIVHQVVTHKILVFLKEDWMNGLHEESMGKPVGIIETNFKTGKFQTLNINIDDGSWWKGFTSMVNLGMEHIREGTDHLLFLITLLLPATLLVYNKKWAGYAGTKYSLLRLLKIVTAFTIGHSVTLLIGASGLFVAPSQIIEVLIAVSILASAIHAFHPIFPGKEFYIAGGFGLTHGLAFASLLSNMNLSTGTLGLSILGFNLGIEMMQLFIITLIIPWLMLLSQTPEYKYFRVTGALLASVAATGWIVQRISGNANIITNYTDEVSPHAIWLIVALAILSISFYVMNKQDVYKFRQLSALNNKHDYVN